MIHYLLYLIVFISGGVLMGLEIIGSRVLASYFGNSVFVWGSLISVVLAALSLGCFWGDWLSTLSPSFNRLLGLLLVPGFLIFFLPFLYPSINRWISEINFGARLNPLIASAVFFLLPSICLGAISPYAVRLSATALSTVGSTAGTIYAIATGGSIFGTLLTAFYLIPVIGVSNIVHALGISLILLSLLSWPLAHLELSKISLAFSFAAISGILTNAGLARAKNLFEKDSFYHRIVVEETREARYLYFDNTLQSAMNLDDPADLKLLYLRYTSLGLTLRSGVERALIIGLGGGSIPKKYQREFPSMEIDVAEIDPAVIEVAKSYFHFREGEKLRVYPMDGRLFLSRTNRPYNLILLDAYHADSIPFHLTTREFFEMAGKKLTPRGTMVINVIGSIRGKKSKLIRSLVKTLRRVYPQIYIFPVRGADKQSLEISQNIILLASKDLRRLSIQEIMQRAASMGRNLFPEPLDKISNSYYGAALPDDDVPEFIDDYAPTNSPLHP